MEDTPKIVSFQRKSSAADSDISISLFVPVNPDDGIVRIQAAAPPDTRYSYHGSGLPHPNTRSAFVTAGQQLQLQLVQNTVSFTMKMPNAYYTDFNGTLVGPEVLVGYIVNGVEQVHQIPLANPVPYRSLQWSIDRVEHGPMFYQKDDVWASTQEEVLRRKGQPLQRNLV